MMVPLSFSKSDYVGLGLVVWFIQILDRDKIKTDGRIIILHKDPWIFKSAYFKVVWHGININKAYRIYCFNFFFKICWKSEIIETQVEQTSPNIGIVPI